MRLGSALYATVGRPGTLHSTATLLNSLDTLASLQNGSRKGLDAVLGVPVRTEGAGPLESAASSPRPDAIALP